MPYNHNQILENNRLPMERERERERERDQTSLVAINWKTKRL